MKPTLYLRSFLLVAASSLFCICYANAAPYYWDVNGTGAGFSTVVGAWNGTNAFWNDAASGTGGTPTATVGSTDDLNIVAATTNTGTITLTGARAASSITFASGVGAVTMSGAGSSLALGGTGALQGIFNNSASNQIVNTAITLATASTLNNSGAGSFSIAGGLNLNSFVLTVSGTGVTTFDGNAVNVISGAGGLIKNGSGSLILSGGTNVTHSFTGGISLNGGSIRFQSSAFLGNTNNSITITDGYLAGRFNSGYTWAALGVAATNNIRITGGTSGFSGEGGTGSTFQIGAALSILKWGALGENSANGFFNPTVLLLGGDQGMNANAKGTLNNAIDLNGTTRTLTSLHNNGDGALTTGFTVSGAISTSTGTAGIIKTGPGNIIFNAANTYNGGTTISGGTLTLNAASTLGTNVNTNNVSLAAGTRLNLSNTVNTGANQTITLTSTAGSLSVLALSYNGALNAATAQADTNGGVIAINSVVGYNQNLSSRLTGNNFFLGGIGTTTTFTGAVGTVVAGNGSTYRLGGGGGTISFNTANLITGGNTVQIGSTATNGTGTVVFGASQDFTGTTNVASGSTLRLSASQAFTNTVTVDSGATFSTLNTISVAAPITNAGTLSLAGTPTFAGLVTSTNGLTLTGVGPFTFNGGLTLTGANQLVIGTAGTTIAGSGLLTMSGTTINVPNSGAGTIIDMDQQWNGNISTTLVSASGQTITSNGAVTLNANVTVANKATMIFNDGIGETGGARNLTVTNNGGTNTFIVNGINTYTGSTTINSGTFRVGGSGSLGSGNYAGAITLANGTAFQYNSSADQILSGNIGGGSGTLTKSVGTNSTLTLSGNNTYSGVTTISAGTVQFAKQVSLYGNVTANWTAAKINVQSGGTLAFNVGGTDEFTTGNVTTLLTNLAASTGATNGMNAGSNFGFDTTNAAGGTFTIGNVIANSTGVGGGARGLTKLGTGTLVLTNANTYTGATTVSAGVLAVNGSLANTTTTVQSGGTLQGSGGIAGSVTVQNGGTLTAGNNNIESLATGALALQASSTFAYQLDNDAVASVAGDLTAVTGNLTLDLANAAILALIDVGTGSWTAGEELTLISYTGTWNTGLFTYIGNTLADDSTFTFSGIDWLFNYNDTVAGTNYTDDLTGSSFVTMTALSTIPEPSAALLGGLGMLMLLRRKRHTHLPEVTGFLPKRPGTPSGGAASPIYHLPPIFPHCF